MKNKALIWTLSITGIILATYVTISLVAKKPEVNKPLFSAADISSVGNLISGLFKKSDTSSSVYSSDPSQNYNRPLGDAGLDYPVEESVYAGV
jgi:hypothetical protein